MRSAVLAVFIERNLDNWVVAGTAEARALTDLAALLRAHGDVEVADLPRPKTVPKRVSKAKAATPASSDLPEALAKRFRDSRGNVGAGRALIAEAEKVISADEARQLMKLLYITRITTKKAAIEALHRWVTTEGRLQEIRAAEIAAE